MPELHEEAHILRERLEAEIATEDELRDVRLRVLESLEEPRPRRLAWALSFAGAAAVTAAVVVLWPSAESWFEPVTDVECLIVEANAVSTGSCTQPTVIAMAEDRITLAPSTRLEHRPRALRLHHGQATFEVQPRTTTEFRVRVSAATIVVVGTAFTVEEANGRGSVRVTEGVVEVRWKDDGERERIRAGESRSWPRPEPKPEDPEITTPPDGSTPDGSTPPDGRVKPDAPDVRTIMERLFQLRSQRRYDEAVRMLRKASRRRDLSREQRERLSYEAGTVLRQAGRTDDACAHFRKHLKRFPNSPERDQLLNTCD